MTKATETKEKNSEPMVTWTMKVDRGQLNEAKEQAEREGRSLANIIRKLLTDWLTGKHKPFES